MFHTIRKHLSYANVAATLALVFALTGGAVAASSHGGRSAPSNATALGGRGSTGGRASDRLTASTAKSKGTKGPRGPRGSQGPAGKNGAAGATGPAGPAGAAGAKGEKGELGAPGATGEEGVPGKPGVAVKTVEIEPNAANEHCKEGGAEFKAGAATTYACSGHEGKNGTFGSEPLPAGQTLKGVWATTGYAVAASEPADSAVSFADPVVSPEIGENFEYNYIKPEEGEGEPKENLPAGCKGNVFKPVAEPGKLCVFGKEESNVKHAAEIKVLPESTVLGFRIQAISAAQGNVFAQGTWAVTAEG